MPFLVTSGKLRQCAATNGLRFHYIFVAMSAFCPIPPGPLNICHSLYMARHTINVFPGVSGSAMSFYAESNHISRIRAPLSRPRRVGRLGVLLLHQPLCSHSTIVSACAGGISARGSARGSASGRPALHVPPLFDVLIFYHVQYTVLAARLTVWDQLKSVSISGTRGARAGGGGGGARTGGTYGGGAGARKTTVSSEDMNVCSDKTPCDQFRFAVFRNLNQRFV